MSSEQPDTEVESALPDSSTDATNVGGDKDPKADNNNGGDGNKEEEMDADDINSKNATPATNDAVKGDAASADAATEVTQGKENASEKEGTAPTDDVNPPGEKPTEEAPNDPEDAQDSGATLNLGDTGKNGGEDLPIPSDAPVSPRGRGRGRPKRQGKGRWSLSPAAKLKGSPKGKKNRAKGRSLTQSDFVFPESPGNVPEVKRPGINVVDKPALMEPFDQGWTREHVLRGSHDDFEVGKKASDVYYFSPPPYKKKLRSMVEISDYLIKHGIGDLNTDNFTFGRCTIYKAPYDICRYTFRGKADSPKHVVKPKKPVSLGSPLVVKLPVPKKDTPTSAADRGIILVESPTPSTLKIVNPLVIKTKAVAKKRTGGNIKRRSDTPASGPIAKKPSLQAGYIPKLCGMECPAMPGVGPELHCTLCLCLFHPVCVNFEGDESLFVCPSCAGGLEGRNHPGELNGSRLPPLHLGSVHRNQTPGGDGSKRLPPTLMRISPVPEPAPKINLVGSFNVRPPPTLTALSSHVITLPPSVVGKIKLDAPLTLKTNGKDLVIPPNCMIATPTGMKVFLPAGVLSAAGVEPGFAKAINILPNPSNPQTMSVVSEITESCAKPIKIPEVKTLDRTKVKVMTRQYPGINPAACFVQKINSGLICCRRIFQFLTVQDRLRAAQVCRMWKDILSHPLFWNKVKLRESTVMDWEKAAHFLRDNNTKVLDMRGLLHPNNDKNRTWHQFTGVLGKMTQLQEIQFDQCPVQILQGVGEKLTGLRLLSAQFVMDAVLSDSQMWSTNAKIDFNKFKNMTELEELTIRGACGLVLVNGLSGLSNLKNLKSLSLATLKGVKDADYSFLDPLTLLEELELGDCDEMDKEGFNRLQNLSRLTKLRLEGKPKTAASLMQLGESLQTMSKLKSLELVKFALNEEFLQTLKTLKIKNLTLWPETGSRTAEINTAVYKLVHDMSSLESLEWAIMGDQIGEGSDNPEDHHQNESILMLKDNGEGLRVANIREISEKLFSTLPKAKIRVFRIGVPVLGS